MLIATPPYCHDTTLNLKPRHNNLSIFGKSSECQEWDCKYFCRTPVSPPPLAECGENVATARSFGGDHIHTNVATAWQEHDDIEAISLTRMWQHCGMDEVTLRQSHPYECGSIVATTG
jgi:hypothetical protein